MYFHKSIKSILLSILLLKDWKVLLFSFLLALFGASFQGFEFFRLHDVSQVLVLSLDFKILYLLWQIFSWIMSLLLGCLIFPAFTIIVYRKAQGLDPLSFKELLIQAKEIAYKYIIFLFTYYNLLFIIAGGGFLVAIVGLTNNIVYGKGISTIFDLTGDVPLVASFITIGLIASAFVSLLFNIVSPLLVIENDGVISSIVRGMKLVNKELPYILSAWIVVNLVTLIPLVVLSILLHIIPLLHFPQLYAFGLGVFLFLLFYTPIVGLTLVFWNQIYLNITGKMPLSNFSDQQERTSY